MIKKTVLISTLLMSVSLSAAELSSFADLQQNYKQGKSITVVVKGKYCQMHDNNPYKVPVSTMVTTPDAAIFNDQLLAFDVSKFAQGKAPLPQGGLLQRANFLMNNQGKARITLSFFDAETNKQMKELQDVYIDCQLGEGLHIFSS